MSPQVHYEWRTQLYVLTGLGRTRFSVNRTPLIRLLGRYIRRFGMPKEVTNARTFSY